MKLLKCKFHRRGYIEIVSKLEPQYTGKKYRIEQLRVDEVWASVPKAIIHSGIKFYEPVKQSIIDRGMDWPIMVVKSTRHELKGQKAKWGNKINDLPFWMAEDLNVKMNVVWGGSNRLWIARELGYTHIDCAILPSFQAAHDLQKTMRETHQQFYAKKDTKS